jgi:hypothetical protein
MNSPDVIVPGPTDPADLDAALADLQSRKTEWARLPSSIVTAACSRKPLVMDGKHAEVWVYGEVLALDGEPIEGVRVEVEARRPEACEAPSNVRNSTTTDALGRYRTVVGQFGSRLEVCLHVQAIPPERSGLAEAAMSRSAGEMRSAAADSVRIDIQLSETSAG